jgi:hypothetical protein
MTRYHHHSEALMTVLHIEHGITDFDQWRTAFATFAERRRQGGVRAERISRPVDDTHYIVIDLEFDTSHAADQFRGFLMNQVWATPGQSPALKGQPQTKILEAVPMP